MKDEMEKIGSDAAIKRRTVFKPASWLAKVDFINHLILVNNVIITVLAEQTGGKTFFVSLLESTLNQEIKSISIRALAACKGKTIVNHIANQLQLEKVDLAGVAKAVNESKQHVLVIIDDAHNVPESFIKDAMKLIKDQGNTGYFHLCLVADFSIVGSLNKLAVNEYTNLIHSIELGLLNENETRSYVLQRAMADNLIIKPLSDSNYKQFFQLTKGNVATINATMEDFIINCKREPKNSNLITVKRTSMVISALLVVGCAYLYFQLYHGASAPIAEPNKVEGAVSLAVPEQQPEPELVADVQVVSESANELAEEPLTSQIPFWLDSAKLQLVQDSVPKKIQYDDEDDEDYDGADVVAVVDKVIVLPKINKAEIGTEKAEVAKAEVKAEVAKVESKAEVAKAEVKAEVAKVEAKVAIVSTPAVPEKKIIAKPIAAPKVTHNKSGLFTIQLVASHKKEDILRFKKHNPQLATSTIRHFKNQSGTWYVLTLGEFKSRHQAEEKITKLPNDLAKLHPWIRTVSGLVSIG